jgi:hypothetical protein
MRSPSFHRVLATALVLALTGFGAGDASAADTRSPSTRGAAAPVLIMEPRAAQSLDVRYRVAWGADPDHPQPASVDVERRATSYDGGVGLWDPVRHRPHASSVVYRSRAGRTTCFRVRGTGPGGEVGPWSTPECVTTAVDDQRFHAGPRWDTDRDLQHYRHTISRTRQRHAVLSLSDVKARSIWLVVERMTYGGTIAVYLNRHRLGRVHLSGEHRFRARVLVAQFARARRGQVRIVVLSAHRDVRIDGLFAMPPR